MSNLPTEVLYKVFIFLRDSDTNNQQSLRSCTLVCKSWHQPSLYVLYSKVVMKDRMKLRKLVLSVQNNERLGSMVKEIYTNINPVFGFLQDKTASADLMNHLPNLEVINSAQRINYVPIIDALLYSKLTRLKSVTALPLRQEEFDNYAVMVLLMRDRVENLVVTNRMTFTNLDKRASDPINNRLDDTILGRSFNPDKREANFERLFNHLQEFTQLREIYLTTATTDPVGVLESVTDRCLNLHTLRFDIEFQRPTNVYSSDVIHSYKPSPNIKTVHGIEFQYHYSHLLTYIMIKFPQLQSLCLDTRYIHVFNPVEKKTAISFIAYLSMIKSVTLYGLYLNSNDVVNVIRNIWKKPLHILARHVEIKYGDGLNDVAKIDIIKNSRLRARNHTNIYYHAQTGDALEHTKVIEIFGKEFKSMVFAQNQRSLPGNTSTLARKMFFGNFINHTLYYCKNLIHLKIDLCRLEKINFELPDGKVKLKALTITNSVVNEQIFEEFSKVINTFAYLKLAKNVYISDVARANPYAVSINMMNTNINALIINFSTGIERCLYIQLYTPATGCYRFYKYDFTNARDGFINFANTRTRNGIIEEVAEDERGDNRCLIIHLRCAAIGHLEVVCINQSASIDLNL